MATAVKETKKVATKATTGKSANAKEVKAQKEVKVEKATEKKATENKVKKERKVVPTVQQMTNSEMAELFKKCGCSTNSSPKDSSNVVYNTFGTKSRVLQQGKAYQLLLTNGHKLVKDELVACDNDDTARFMKFYKGLTKEEQGLVGDYDTIDSRVLSRSEFPRERSVKINNYDLLVKFITFMAGFDENKIVKAEA